MAVFTDIPALPAGADENDWRTGQKRQRIIGAGGDAPSGFVVPTSIKSLLLLDNIYPPQKRQRKVVLAFFDAFNKISKAFL